MQRTTLRRRVLSALAVGALVATSGAIALQASPASAAGFTDGGFEGAGDGGGHGTGSHFGPWTVTVADVQVVSSNWAPREGTHSIDLDGNTGSRGTICQTFDTDPGVPYALDFSLSRNGRAPGVPNGALSATVRVTVAGTSQDYTHDDPAWTPSDPRWEDLSQAFTPTGPSSTVCFASIASTVAGWGPAIDAVSVHQTAPAQPFVCDPSRVFLAQGGSTQLKELVAGSGSSTFSDIGSPAGFSYNGIAYDDAGDLIYGTAPSGDVVQVDATGAVRDLGPTNPPIAQRNAGAIDSATGTFYTLSSGTSTLYEVSLSDLTQTPVALSAVNPAADVTFIDGVLWGDGAGSTIARIDPASGAVTTVPVAGVPASLAAGAAWTYANGNLGLSDNATGDIYQIHIDSPTAATLVSVSSGPPAAGASDGTSCQGPPADLQLTKTVTPEVLQAGAPISWTITVKNNGPGISSGHVVKDTIPAAVTGLSTSSPGCSLAGNQLTCVGGVLAVGDSVSYTVSGTAPTNGAAVKNDATVTGNETDPAPGNEHGSATSFGQIGLCEGRALGLPLGINLSVANPATIPCGTDANTVVDAKLTIGPPVPLLSPFVRVQAVNSASTKAPGLYHGESSIAVVTISVPLLGLNIQATGLHSEANAAIGTSCASAALSSISRLATLTINGTPIKVGDQPITIPLVIGSLSINQLQQSGGAVVRRVINLDLPGTLLDVVVGESMAGVACVPA